MCGAESEAITGWPDDKIVQSEHGRRTKVGGDGIEGEIKCEVRLDEEYIQHIYSTIDFICFYVLKSSTPEGGAVASLTPNNP